MDTCIAIRTMTFKDGTAYLQAGGGIVFDSVEEEEYVESLNKLQSNVRALQAAESECPSDQSGIQMKLIMSCRVLAQYSE